MELDHIVPRAERGSDDIDNAIPLCFECHAEVHAYNDAHPRGRKFRPDELRAHRDQWIAICKTNPSALIAAPLNNDVGPLQALLDELEFNMAVVPVDKRLIGCSFMTEQFVRATAAGAIAILDDRLKTAVLDAYVAIGTANRYIDACFRDLHGYSRPADVDDAHAQMRIAEEMARAAYQLLLKFMRSEATS
jgi:HNH endonuclease